MIFLKFVVITHPGRQKALVKPLLCKHVTTSLVPTAACTNYLHEPESPARTADCRRGKYPGRLSHAHVHNTAAAATWTHLGHDPGVIGRQG